MHLLCATHTLAPLGALSAHIPTMATIYSPCYGDQGLAGPLPTLTPNTVELTALTPHTVELTARGGPVQDRVLACYSSDWHFIAEQPAPAPHLARPEGLAALMR